MTRPSVVRSVYGGGLKGGPWSDAAKMKVVRRLVRMLVRLVLGRDRVAEYDARMDHYEALTVSEQETEIKRLKATLKALLE
jgi:hypothetical protein